MRAVYCWCALLVLFLLLSTNWSAALLRCRRLDPLYRWVLQGRRRRLGLYLSIAAPSLFGAGRPPLRVLDFGCGTGVVSEALRRSGHAVSSVDIRDHYVFPKREDLHIVEAGSSLPFPDDAFSCAVASYCFHHIPASLHAQLLRELLRVCPLLILIEEPPSKNLVCRLVNSEVWTHANEHRTAQSWQAHLFDLGLPLASASVVPLPADDFALLLQRAPRSRPGRPGDVVVPPP